MSIPPPHPLRATSPPATLRAPPSPCLPHSAALRHFSARPARARYSGEPGASFDGIFCREAGRRADRQAIARRARPRPRPPPSPLSRHLPRSTPRSPAPHLPSRAHTETRAAAGQVLASCPATAAGVRAKEDARHAGEQRRHPSSRAVSGRGRGRACGERRSAAGWRGPRRREHGRRRRFAVAWTGPQRGRCEHRALAHWERGGRAKRPGG